MSTSCLKHPTAIHLFDPTPPPNSLSTIITLRSSKLALRVMDILSTRGLPESSLDRRMPSWGQKMIFLEEFEKSPSCTKFPKSWAQQISGSVTWNVTRLSENLPWQLNLKPAVNRQPLFPREEPEELANLTGHCLVSLGPERSIFACLTSSNHELCQISIKWTDIDVAQSFSCGFS